MQKKSNVFKVIYSDPERPVPFGNSADVKLLSCHLTPIQPDLRISEHEHSHWELSFMISGEMKTLCDGNMISCHENNAVILLIPPGISHKREFGSSGNNCNLTIEFLLNDAASIYDAAEQCLANSYQFKATDFLKSLLEEIRRLSRENMETPHWLLAQLSQIFLLSFLLKILHVQTDHKTVPPVTWKFRDDEIRANDIFRFLNTHISGKHLLKDLSDFYGLSLRQLNRIFEKKYNATLSEKCDEIRFKRSVLLLKTTVLTIREIAEESGFSTPAGFYLFFKRHAGITPHTFRRQKNGIPDFSLAGH